MNYFSSDFHLGHANILRFDNRDFRTIREHDEFLIKMCMKTLKKGDNFYYLGDFALTSKPIAKGYIETLASSGANLFFIKGNHDKYDNIGLFQTYGAYLGEKKTVKIDYKGDVYPIVMDHFANRVWDRSHHGVYHLYGHSHDKLEKEPWGRSMDCGIMSAFRIKGEYSLFSFEDIHNILKNRPIKVIDHHGKTEEDD